MKESLSKIISHYGKQHQTYKAIEEMAELTQALLKHMDSLSEKTRNNVIEEIADVSVMLAQLEIIYDCEDEVNAFAFRKTIRQLDRMESEQ